MINEGKDNNNNNNNKDRRGNNNNYIYIYIKKEKKKKPNIILSQRSPQSSNTISELLNTKTNNSIHINIFDFLCVFTKEGRKEEEGRGKERREKN